MLQQDKIHTGDRVLIIDNLVATGGTLGSAISLVKMLEGIVVECACIVELKMLTNPHPDSGIPSWTKLFSKMGHDNTPIWGLISKDILLEEAQLPPNYVDDGEGH
jgi:orotate phosphoribosyltransferase